MVRKVREEEARESLIQRHSNEEKEGREILITLR
jgi:hypothetical protein